MPWNLRTSLNNYPEQRPHPAEREAEGGAAGGAAAAAEDEDGGQQREVDARGRAGEGEPRPGGRGDVGGTADHETEEPGT